MYECMAKKFVFNACMISLGYPYVYGIIMPHAERKEKKRKVEMKQVAMHMYVSLSYAAFCFV